MIEDVLTHNPIKKLIYLRDVAFIDSINATREIWPETSDLISFLWNHTAILLRPEAILARRSRFLFPMLRAHGLIPVSARRIHLAPEQVSMIWRYQANVMTRGHHLFLQQLLSAGPSIYIVLKDNSERISTPAAGHVTYLKGATLTAKRRPLHLRSIAGPAIANSLSYIHASDDPADFMRELAVLFPRNIYLDILLEAAVGQDRTGDVFAKISEAELYAPRNVLSGDYNAPETELSRSWSSEQLVARWNWNEIIKQAQKNRSYISGEAYDTRMATIPDDKRYLAQLDNHLIFTEFGEGF